MGTAVQDDEKKITSADPASPEPVDTPPVAVEPDDPDLNDSSSETYETAMEDAPPEPPKSEAPAAPEVPEGIVVDEKGMWRNKDGTFATKQPTEAAAKVVEAELAKPVEEPPTPFKANVYGAEQEVIPGALYKKGHGVFIPEAQVGRLHQLAAHASKYGDFQQLRQERAAERKQFDERVQFYGQKFGEVLQSTLLNHDWFQWAAASPENFETAKMQVQLKLQQGEFEATEKFGKVAATAPTEPHEADPLDAYQAEAAVEALLTELLNSPDYHGKLTAADAQAVKDQIKAQDVPVFHYRPDQGWLLDERPFRAAMALRVHTPVTPKAPPKVEVVQRRNAAAVPQAPAVPAKADPKPTVPAADDQPWNNPSLDFQERRRLWEKAKGFASRTDG